MNMQFVQSSDIQAVGYEGSTLCIRFNSGGIYQYSGVPQSVHIGLMTATSHGKYFHTFIKGRYPHMRIG